MMFIKNYSELATNKLRKDALDIVVTGIEAADPAVILRKKVFVDGSFLKAGKSRVDLSKYKNIYIVGAGKASFRAAKFLEGIMLDYITAGVILDVKVGKLKKIECYEGSHPFPTKGNIEATSKLTDILKAARKNDLVIALISGGGSSLLCDPYKMTCNDIKSATKSFFSKGADIKEINILRKHISKIHGGYMAKLAYPADVLGLIFSDVPFSDISLVASGPTFMDKTTKDDAKKIAEKYGISGVSLIETPKDKKYFEKTRNELILSNKDALKAMKDKAEEKGYKTEVCGACLKGEARELASKLVERLKKNKVLLGGGETTVTIEKKGKGGRNLEVAIGIIDYLPENSIVVSMASDGKDHISGVGGGLVDEEVIKKAKELNYDHNEFLRNNISYKFMKDTGGLIESRRTGTNVSDLVVMLKA
ncbi:MAG: DUF4147 domain-containing protein [Candidatus Colwellbacteria bacterium]|nr:DUF4147 domain-containing protein [Candidatus Colwellbacteria bacterium]